MKTLAQAAALALIALSLAPQARADEAKSFDVAAATSRAERRAALPGIIDATDGRTNRLNAPIVIEILSADCLPDLTGVAQSAPSRQNRSCASPPAKLAKR